MFISAARVLLWIDGPRHAISIPRHWLAAIGFFVCSFMPYCARAGDQPRTIRLSTQSPADSPSIQSLVHFKQRAEADSGGALRIEIIHSGKLYGDGQIGAAVGSGAVEMGYVNLARYAETILIADAFELPFVFNTAELEKAARAPGSEIRQIIEEAVLTHTGSRVLWWVPEGQIVFFAKGMSVANPERLVGKTVRIVGPLIESAVRMCGGEPRTIGGTEQVKAYERREVDVGMSSIATVLGRKIYKSMDTITRTNHASAEFVVVINEGFWQSLSGEQRAVLTAAADSAGTVASDTIAKIEANAYRQLAEYGAKVISLTDDELIAWRICSSDVMTEFMSQTGELGHQLMMAYGRLRRDDPSQARKP